MNINWEAVHTQPDCYTVFVGDNYHHGDPDEQYAIPGFPSAEAALAKCRAIVETCLRECAEPGRGASAVLVCYQMFGDDPWIGSPKDMPSVKFSSWDCAAEAVHKFVC